MKKLLVLLLALSMVAGAFAQATVGGYVRVRGVIAEDAAYDEFDFTYVNRLRLNLGWTSEDGNVHFAARLQAEPAATGVAPLWTNFAFGRVRLADKMVVISAGALWNTDYTLASGASEWYLGNVENNAELADTFGEHQGMLFQVLPVEGLSLGLMARPDGAELSINQFDIYGRYTIEGIGNVVAHWAFNDPIEDEISASFQFTGVEDLVVAVGYKANSGENAPLAGINDTDAIFGIVDYTIGDLTAEVAAEFNITDEWVYVEGFLRYDLAKDLFVLGTFAYDQDSVYLGGAVVANDSTYFVGLELQHTIGRAYLAVHLTYDDFAGFQIPLAVRVTF
ncbi:MAG TPA: hypothetical protein VLH39_00895 [Magnetospirillaceae bacterium]|nr:hypothetical protein [Magnetospirillaceae bacterium]